MPPNRFMAKQILPEDDEKDGLDVLQEELEDDDLKTEQACSDEEVISRITSPIYDLEILDTMAVRGFELLDYTNSKNIPVVMHTADSLSAVSLKRPMEFGARDCLPKDKLGKVALS